MAERKLLLEHSHDPAFRTLEGFKAKGGYKALAKALGMERQAIIDEVKASGLRGRGGAGFPTWIKWNGLPKEKTKPHYVLCNADEGEPGTFKDKQLMEVSVLTGADQITSLPHCRHFYFFAVQVCQDDPSQEQLHQSTQPGNRVMKFRGVYFRLF